MLSARSSQKPEKKKCECEQESWGRMSKVRKSKVESQLKHFKPKAIICCPASFPAFLAALAAARPPLTQATAPSPVMICSEYLIWHDRQPRQGCCYCSKGVLKGFQPRMGCAIPHSNFWKIDVLLKSIRAKSPRSAGPTAIILLPTLYYLLALLNCILFVIHT